MRYRFIGIGGASMSGLACYLKECGNEVTGSDIAESEFTQLLKDRGIPLDIGHFPEYAKTWDKVVYTAAIKQDDPELKAAAQLNIPLIKRSELLGEVFNSCTYGIAVAGMHGKSTCTSMLSEIFERAGMNPTFFIGAKRASDGKSYGKGSGRVVIAEACEYEKSFLTLKPYITAILNMELEHTDCYRDTAEVYKAFNLFAKSGQTGGSVVAHEDAAKALHTKCVTYGVGARCAFRAENIRTVKGKYSFDVLYHNRFTARVSLSVYGRHNVDNALCAFAVSFISGISARQISQALEAFKGVERRFQLYGNSESEILLDYAHHPSEIAATLKAARECTQGKLLTVFQPHTYSRTKRLLSDFVEAFALADEVILLPVYSAREKPIVGGASEDLNQALRQIGIKSTLYSSFDKAAEAIKEKAYPVTAILGAGDVYKLKDMLL